MLVKLTKTVSEDDLILASSDEFHLNVDQADLACRRSLDIYDAYHKDWFYENQGETFFIPSAACIKDGKIFFINGRHRAILLSRHLKEFPLLVTHIDYDKQGCKQSQVSIDTLSKIKQCGLKNYAVFQLPDLSYGNFKKS